MFTGWEPKIRLGWDRAPATGLLKPSEDMLPLLAGTHVGAGNTELDLCCSISSAMGALEATPLMLLLSSANVLSRLRAWWM